MSHTEKESNSHPPPGGKFIHFISIQWVTCIPLFATPCTATCQDSISIGQSPNLVCLISFVLVVPSCHLIVNYLLFLPSIFLNLRVFSNESFRFIRCPSYWSFTFSISPSSEHLRLISFRKDWFDLFSAKVLSTVFSNTTVHKHQFFSAQLSLQSISLFHTCLLGKPQP